MRIYLVRSSALAGIAFVALNQNAIADNDWPPLNGNETRQEVPVNIGGTLFFSGRYIYDVPRYHLKDFQKTDSYERYHWHWWAEVPIGDPNGVNAHIVRQPAAGPGTLPGLPPLPPIKPIGKTPPVPPVASLSKTPLTPLAPVQKVPTLPQPESTKLPNLPSLPPLR